jgi:murein DD-endopeptidase MepM/ murein hydrolase activator NlpD
MSFGQPNNPSSKRRSRRSRRFRNLQARERGVFSLILSKIAPPFRSLASLFSKKEDLIPDPSDPMLPSKPPLAVKRIVLMSLSLLVVIGVLLYFIFRPFGDKPQEGLPPGPPPAAEALGEDSVPLPASAFPRVSLPQGLFSLDRSSQAELTVNRVEVAKGGSFSQAFTLLGLDNDQKSALTDLIQREDSVSAASEGDAVKAFWASPEKTPESLERIEIYPKGRVRPLVFLPGGPMKFVLYGAGSEPIDIYEAYEFSLSDHGFVREAGLAGLPYEAVGTLTELLSSRVDFLTGLKTGDYFKLLFLETYEDGRLVKPPVLKVVYFKINDVESAYYKASFPGGGDDGFYNASFRSVKKDFLLSPLQYDLLAASSSSSPSSSPGNSPIKLPTITKEQSPDRLGTEYLAPSGTPVSAIAAGIVKFAGRRGSFGNLIILSHEDGYESLYGHLSGFAEGIKTGASVDKGDLIGKVGMTGAAFRPRLDFRLKKGEEFKDPESELNSILGEEIPEPYRHDFSAEITELDRIFKALEPYDPKDT